MKVFITKSALTKGIVEREDAEIDKWYPEWIEVPGRYASRFYGPGEWFTNNFEAQINACDRVLARIQKLEKEIMKLKSLKF